MKRKMAKVLCIILSLMMFCGVFLTGCNEKQPSNTEVKDIEKEPKDNSKENKKEEKVKLTFWHNYGADKETPFFQDVVMPMFNEKYPNIEVEVIAQGNDQYKEQIIISAGTKTTPDMARLDLMDVAGLAKIGAIMPIDDLEGFDELKSKVFEGPLATNFYKGKHYGLPLDTNCKAAVFNMNVLKELGFDDVPKTMEEFIKASKEKSPSKYTLNVSSAGEWDFVPYFWLFGGVLTDEEFTKASGYLDSKQSIDAVNKLVKIHEDKMFTIKEIDGTTDAWDGIKSGEYAMFLEGPWFFTFNSDWEENGLKPALIPTYNGKTASVVGGESISIFSTCKHPKEAFEFIKFLLSEEVQVLMGSEMGQMPVLKSAAENEKLMNDKVWSVYLQQLNTAQTRIPSPQTSAIQEHLKDAFDSILRGEMSTEEALSEAAELIDEELAK